MKSRIILTFGNCQVGKSSFINTIKGSEIAKVGGWGEAVTTATHFYEIGPSNLLYKNDPNDSKLYIIDTQGLSDSNLMRSDLEILTQIRMKLFEENCSELAGILIFDSATASSVQIKRVIRTALQLFGAKLMASVIGITCKWDELTEDLCAVRSKIYEEIREIPIIKWQNNTEEEIVTGEKMEAQLLELTRALARIRPYKVEEIKLLDEECRRRAEILRENDPNRYSVVFEEYVEKVVQEYEVEETYTEVEKKYTDDESIRKRAYELQQAAGTHTVKKTRVVPTEQLQEYMDVEIKFIPKCSEGLRKYFIFGPREKTNWTEIYQVPVKRHRYSTVNIVEEFREQEYYPIENYMTLAIAETHEVTKNRMIRKQRIQELQGMREIKLERFDLSYYISKVRLQMINENKRLNSL